MDITEAYERYKTAVSDMNEAIDALCVTAQSLPDESIRSVVENLQNGHEILVKVSKDIMRSLRSITSKVKELESEIREATGSMVFMAMAADHQPMQPDTGVRGGADDAAAAPQALISSDLNKAPSEDADQEDNLAEPKEREENNIVDSEQSTEDPSMSAMHID